MRFKFIFLMLTLEVKGWTDNKIRKFKDEFWFGAGTSAYQVEGAWNSDGKGESILDRYYHNNPEVMNGTNGDIACDSYYKYKRDVEMLRELGVNFYRFSISWPRILPKGFAYDINDKGVEYYNNLIDELLKYNIEPMVTLYHHDLPQILQDLGGWANPSSIMWFEEYANVIFDNFASKVKYWITINQPSSVCMGYASLKVAPSVGIAGITNYICDRHILLAHAKAFRLYESKYKVNHKGSVGISLEMEWYDPFNTDEAHTQAAASVREASIDYFMHPIFSKTGDFPPSVREKIAQKRKELGDSETRLSELSSSEVELIKGSADFLGINHFTTKLIKASKTNSTVADVNAEVWTRKEWKKSHSTWLKSVPYGLYRLLIYLNEKYDYPQIFITEHGWSTDKGLQDETRVDNLRDYLSALLLALEDGTEVKGYTVWSLMDNVEWNVGTRERFGLYEVDFESEQKTRTARLSALVYKRIIQKRIVEQNWKPKNLKIKISKNKVKEEL